MSYNIEDINKQNFICFKFADESIYYGEIAYMDKEQKIITPDKFNEIQEPDQKEKYKKVRHGNGIQIYKNQTQLDADENPIPCKYEGQWDRDRKHGEGRCWYPDGSTYVGRLYNDIMDGYGKYQWANGDLYEGNWRNGRFEGGGKFVHNDGHMLQGIFKNNYIKQNEFYVNPFMNKEEMDKFISNRSDIEAIREKNYNQKLFQFKKCVSLKDARDFILKSSQNNRIPLILSSKQLLLKKQELYAKLKELFQKNIFEFDLRQIYQEKIQEGNCNKYLEQTKLNLSNALVKGDIFIINIDDSDVQYDEIFDPDIREFYKATHFPSQIWNIQRLKKPEVFEEIVKGTEHKFAQKISKNFQLIVWSKLKIDQDLDNIKILEKFDRRFSSLIPLPKMDLLMLCEEDEQNANIENPIKSEMQPQQQQQQQQQQQEQKQQQNVKK